MTTTSIVMEVSYDDDGNVTSARMLSGVGSGHGMLAAAAALIMGAARESGVTLDQATAVLNEYLKGGSLKP